MIEEFSGSGAEGRKSSRIISNVSLSVAATAGQGLGTEDGAVSATMMCRSETTEFPTSYYLLAASTLVVAYVPSRDITFVTFVAQLIVGAHRFQSLKAAGWQQPIL